MGMLFIVVGVTILAMIIGLTKVWGILICKGVRKLEEKGYFKKYEEVTTFQYWLGVMLLTVIMSLPITVPIGTIIVFIKSI